MVGDGRWGDLATGQFRIPRYSKVSWASLTFLQLSTIMNHYKKPFSAIVFPRCSYHFMTISHEITIRFPFHSPFSCDIFTFFTISQPWFITVTSLKEKWPWLDFLTMKNQRLICFTDNFPQDFVPGGGSEDANHPGYIGHLRNWRCGEGELTEKIMVLDLIGPWLFWRYS